jgi:hypothetical protein
MWKPRAPLPRNQAPPLPVPERSHGQHSSGPSGLFAGGTATTRGAELRSRGLR